MAGEIYQANWESLGNYRAPEWLADAKFGIWPHWGIYSVPAFSGEHAAEWYGRWMYTVQKGELPPPPECGRHRANEHWDAFAPPFVEYHTKKYGAPKEFGYHDFIPMWQAEKWDPEEWGDLATRAGAKYFCMMGMHHDGFALYDSELTRWKATNMGPKRDLMGEMSKVIRRRGLKLAVSNHFAWNYEFFGFYHRNGFAAGQEDLADFYSHGKVDAAYLKRWWERTTELVTKTDCDLYYFDWGWNRDPWRADGWHEKFAAFYYNYALQAGKGSFGDPGVALAVKVKDFPAHTAIREVERGQMAGIQPHLWQTDTSISCHSWGYSENDEYRSATQLLGTLLDIVSKNGVMLLNFGPKADGSVVDEYRQPLLEMGAWLAVCGEAVYATRPYAVYGEGPSTQETVRKEDHEMVYGKDDIRFTCSKGRTILYATALAWPGATMLIKTLKGAALDDLKRVELLGVNESLKWQATPNGLAVTMPPQPPYQHAYPLKLTFGKEVPGAAKKGTLAI